MIGPCHTYNSLIIITWLKNVPLDFLNCPASNHSREIKTISVQFVVDVIAVLNTNKIYETY